MLSLEPVPLNVAVALAVLVVRRTIPVTAEELFDAWLDPQALAAAA